VRDHHGIAKIAAVLEFIALTESVTWHEGLLDENITIRRQVAAALRVAASPLLEYRKIWKELTCPSRPRGNL
jgi:hypothetical protein